MLQDGSSTSGGTLKVGVKCTSTNQTTDGAAYGTNVCFPGLSVEGAKVFSKAPCYEEGAYHGKIYVCPSVSNPKSAVTLYIYEIAFVKEDDYSKLASLIGLTANNVLDILTNAETLLNNKNAVNFMLKQCTGSFMVQAIQNSIFLTALENSPYKTIIQANEHWNKFLNMVA